MSGHHGLLLFVAVASVAMSACGTTTPESAPDRDEPPTAVIRAEIRTSTPSPAPTLRATLAAAIPAATSRGPDLEASDPATARLDAGSLQFVEFFRFT